MMENNRELDWRHQGEQLTRDFQGKASPEVLAIVKRADEELRNSGIAATAMRAGEKAPDFTSPNAVGRPYHLADGLARGPVVVTFYRGAWCPYCNLQLKMYQKILHQIHATGASLVAISPQTPDQSQATLLHNFLEYEVLSDLGNRVGRAYGLVYPLNGEMRKVYLGFGIDLSRYNGDDSWEIPLPGTFVVARNAVIRLAFVDPDYRKRLQPAELLAVLQKMAAEG
jgi:peroxiredoxin